MAGTAEQWGEEPAGRHFRQLSADCVAGASQLLHSKLAGEDLRGLIINCKVTQLVSCSCYIHGGWDSCTARGRAWYACTCGLCCWCGHCCVPANACAWLCTACNDCAFLGACLAGERTNTTLRICACGDVHVMRYWGASRTLHPAEAARRLHDD